MARTTSGFLDDNDVLRCLKLLLTIIGGVSAVAVVWKALTGEKVKPRELIAALLTLAALIPPQ